VDVDYVGAGAAKEFNKGPPRFAVPNHFDRYERSASRRPSLDVVTEPLETLYPVTVGLQGCALLVCDSIFAARSSGAVSIVDDDDPHYARALSSGRAPAGGAKSDAATARSKMYADASPSPTSVYEAMRQYVSMNRASAREDPRGRVMADTPSISNERPTRKSPTSP
jgi:hypothetical protein